MTDIDQIKAQARKTAFAARKEAFARGQGQAADLLADLLAAHQGPVGVPVILGPAQPLRFREWSPGCTMVAGDFGALIPQDGAWIDPQVVIVPLVGFDARGYRLGYGGGFYDRTLAGLRARHPVLAVGFAFDAQELPEVPIDAYDQRLDVIVTESGIRHFT